MVELQDLFKQILLFKWELSILLILAYYESF